MKEEEYETEDVTVQIVELSPDDIAKSNNWIGRNKPIYEGDKNSDDDAESSNDEDDEGEVEQVPGFTVTSTKPSKKQNAEKKDTENAENIDENNEKPVKKKKIPQDFKSKRAMGQFFAKQAQNTLKHSKAFQTKNKLERIRNKKKARIEKEKRIKLQNKREKHKKNPSKTVKTNKFDRKSKSKGKRNE